MQRFEHFNASTANEAVSILNEYGEHAKVIAGGTDLLGCLRDGIWPEPPRAIINLKTVSELNYIAEEDDGVRIGAVTTLAEVADSALIREKYASLGEAARRTASPLLRNIGTLAGNICQENRCWYYRYPNQLGGRIDCIRKGGKKCLAVQGDNRYHSIFGAVNKCIAVNPSDTAPALVALSARIETSQRVIDIDAFFTAKNGMKSTVLEEGEIVTAIFLPKADPGWRTAFKKIALRKTIDFSIVNCAVAVMMRDSSISAARICLNGVHNNPYRPLAAEEILIGRSLEDVAARAAGEEAIAHAKPLPMNRYKVQMAQELVVDTLLACGQD